VLGLIVLLFVVWFTLGGLLWLGSLWLQGYIYNQPAEGLHWRAPAAGTALAFFYALWCVLDYGSAEPAATELPYETFFRFSPQETYPKKPIPEFWSIKKGSTKEGRYVRKQVPARAGCTRPEYVNPESNRPWSRQEDGIVETIIIEENGQKVKFKARLIPDPNYKKKSDTEPERMVFPEVAVFVEEGGSRTLTEDELRVGQMTRFRFGLFVMNVIINVLHLAVWFACLWLLLRFQMWHALGLAVVFWLVMTFAVLPTLLDQTLEAVRAKAKPAAMGRPESRDATVGRVS